MRKKCWRNALRYEEISKSERIWSSTTTEEIRTSSIRNVLTHRNVHVNKIRWQTSTIERISEINQVFNNMKTIRIENDVVFCICFDHIRFYRFENLHFIFFRNSDTFFQFEIEIFYRNSYTILFIEIFCRDFKKASFHFIDSSFDRNRNNKSILQTSQ